MNVQQLKKTLSLDSTVLEENGESKYLLLITQLNVGDIIDNKPEFISIINDLIYSFRENFLSEKDIPKEYFNWISKIENSIDDEKIRLFLIYSIEEFTDSHKNALNIIKSESGKKLLIKNT